MIEEGKDDNRDTAPGVAPSGAQGLAIPVGKDSDTIFLAADFFNRWMTAAATAMDGQAGRLDDLDDAIGDGDHGTNMQRGFAAVTAALERDAPDTPGAVLTLAGRFLISTAGETAGPLYGILLHRTGQALGDAAEVSRAQLTEALRRGVTAVAQLGGAKAGDKTMLDVLEPGGAALDESFTAARAAAEEGACATVPMLARKGKASALGERTIGHQDPGAASSAALIIALQEAARM